MLDFRDLNAGRFGLGATQLVQHARTDKAGEQREDYQDHKQFDQREAGGPAHARRCWMKGKEGIHEYSLYSNFQMVSLMDSTPPKMATMMNATRAPKKIMTRGSMIASTRSMVRRP